jgi:hypothetical protein
VSRKSSQITLDEYASKNVCKKLFGVLFYSNKIVALINVIFTNEMGF